MTKFGETTLEAYWSVQDKLTPEEAACLIHDWDPRKGDLKYLHLKGFPNHNAIENTVRALARYDADKEDFERLLNKHQIEAWCEAHGLDCPNFLRPTQIDLSDPKSKEYHKVCNMVCRVRQDPNFTDKTEMDVFTEAHKRLPSPQHSVPTIKSIWTGKNTSASKRGFTKEYIARNYQT